MIFENVKNMILVLGKQKVKQSIMTNINGKKDSYDAEYYIEKDGEKRVIKEKGNKKLYKSLYKNFKPQLSNSGKKSYYITNKEIDPKNDPIGYSFGK